MLSNFGGIGPANWLFSTFLLKHGRLKFKRKSSGTKFEKIASSTIYNENLSIYQS
jgi:hypothetical protein